MGLSKRIGDILSANLNELVDSFEDPERMLGQAIREMEQALESALDAAAKTLADEKLLRREVEGHQKQTEFWLERAKAAVAARDDATAREALVRKHEYQTIVAALADQLSHAEAGSRRLRRQVEAMRVKIADAHRRLNGLCARNRAAIARRSMAAACAVLPTHDIAFARFDRLSHKVDRAEAESEAFDELTQQCRLTESLETAPCELADRIERELEGLKQQGVRHGTQ